MNTFQGVTEKFYVDYCDQANELIFDAKNLIQRKIFGSENLLRDDVDPTYLEVYEAILKNHLNI